MHARCAHAWAVARAQGPEAEASEHCGTFWREVMRVPASLPIVAGLPVGHARRNSVVPLGCTARLCLDHGTLSFGHC